MPRSHFARLSVILLVVAALSVPPAWGAPRRVPNEVSPLAIFARVWSSLTAIWAGEGSTGDPHGGRSSQSPTTDEGDTLDPHGGSLAPPPTTDSGSTPDPHGG